MSFNALIVGGGVAGMQCALVLGSAKNKAFAADKNIGIILHQKTSHLQNALFNNVLGLPPGKLGANVLVEGKKQLATLYPQISQIENEKVIAWLSFKSFYGRPAYAGTIEIAIYIDEQFRAKGIGKTILQFAISAAKERNIHTLLAYIFEHNLPSIQFFQKNGFVNYGVLPEIAIMDQKHYSLGIYGLKIS